MPVSFDLVNRRSSRQLGLITRTQLLSLGLPPRSISNWIASGRLRAVGRGVYLVAGAPWNWHARAMARCLEHDGLASHATAAVLLGADTLPRGTPEVIVPHGRRAAGSPGVYRTRHFEALRPRAIDRIPTVGGAVAALQLATLVPDRLSVGRFEDAVEQIVRAGSTSWFDIDAATRNPYARRMRNVGRVRSLAGMYLATGAESRLEVDFVAFVHRWQLPPPTPQHLVQARDGTSARLDFAWDWATVGTELDSVQFHLTRDAFERDKAKRNALRLDGWLLFEVTHRHLRDHPAALAVQLGTALVERGDGRWTPPAWLISPSR